jgi:hypothetical protein
MFYIRMIVVTTIYFGFYEEWCTEQKAVGRESHALEALHRAPFHVCELCIREHANLGRARKLVAVLAAKGAVDRVERLPVKA